jgi:hypothetical protein
MDVGIGLPNTIPGTDGRLVVEWARRADGGPFSTLGVLDRLAYDSIDPFAALAAAAGRDRARRPRDDDRHRPAAQRGAAGQAGGLGRRAVGQSPHAGPRRRRAARRLRNGQVDHRGRGPRLSSSSQRSETATDLGGPEDLQAPGRRHGRPRLRAHGAYADGYAHNGGPPRAFARAAASAQAAWNDLGRPGRPLLWGQGYFALGDEDAGAAYLRDYYAFTGPFAEQIAAGNLTSARAIRDFVRGYEEAGLRRADPLPHGRDIEQLERLARCWREGSGHRRRAGGPVPRRS